MFFHISGAYIVFWRADVPPDNERKPSEFVHLDTKAFELMYDRYVRIKRKGVYFVYMSLTFIRPET